MFDTLTLKQKVYLYSWGGNGTRMLYELIKKKNDMNRQADTHYRIDRWIGPGDKAIAIIGNPIDSLKSFYRKQNTVDNSFIRRHCENLGIQNFEVTSFHEYAQSGEDLFQLEKYWDSLMNTPRNYKIMFVKFEKLWNHFDEVLHHVGMGDIIDVLPAKKQRSSRIEDVLFPEEIKQLQKTYAPLLEKFANFPDFKVF